MNTNFDTQAQTQAYTITEEQRFDICHAITKTHKPTRQQLALQAELRDLGHVVVDKDTTYVIDQSLFDKIMHNHIGY